MSKVITTTFQLRRGNAAWYKTNNPVLAQGEPAYELDTKKLKIGDGVHNYSAIPYLTDKTQAIIAPLFDEDEFYEVGDYVIKDDTLYQFIHDHNAKPWDGDDVVEDEVWAVLNRLENSINTKYTKPAFGIPTADIADGAITYNKLNSDLSNKINNKIEDIDFPNDEDHNGALKITKNDSPSYIPINNFGNANITTTGSALVGSKQTNKKWEDGEISASGKYSFAQGYGYRSSTNQNDPISWGKHRAIGEGCHVEGANNTAGTTGFGDLNSNYSHAEGFRTHALGHNSHAEGTWTLVSHTKGLDDTTKEGYHLYDIDAHWGCGSGNTRVIAGHAEGCYTEVRNNYSHAEGYETTVLHTAAHAEGHGTITSANYQHVSGEYNADNENAIAIIGNGTDEEHRSNALEVLKDGSLNAKGINVTKTDEIQKNSSNYKTSMLTLEKSYPIQFLIKNIHTIEDKPNKDSTINKIRIQIGNHEFNLNDKNFVPNQSFNSNNGSVNKNSPNFGLCTDYIPVYNQVEYIVTITNELTSNETIQIVCYYEKNLAATRNVVPIDSLSTPPTIIFEKTDINSFNKTFSFEPPKGCHFIRFALSKNLLNEDSTKLANNISINFRYNKPICDLDFYSQELEVDTPITSGYLIKFNALTGEVKIPDGEEGYYSEFITEKPNLLMPKKENIIYSTSGDIDITYKLDPQLIYENFESRIANLEASLSQS